MYTLKERITINYALMTRKIFQENGTRPFAVDPENADLETTSNEKQALLAEIKRLKQMNKEYKSTIYHFSHDLNGPLNNIVSLINLLFDAKDPDEIVALSKPVMKSINKFKTSMNELLRFKAQETVPEKGGMVNIKNVINEVIESINGQFQQSGTVLTQALQITHIKFPKMKLRSILFNLISNAIKYRSPERISNIHISTYQKDNFIVLSVMDNGTGIPSQKMDKLFTKFGTLHDESYPGESLGIGLFLVKNIVDENGGKIEVESELGKGSLFKIYLNREIPSFNSSDDSVSKTEG